MRSRSQRRPLSLETRGTNDQGAAARAYWYWHRSGPFDEGRATGKALGGIRDERTAAAASMAAADRSTQANGCLMRISPLGILGHALPVDMLADFARADASLTHPHPICQEAVAVFAVATAGAIAGALLGAVHGYDALPPQWRRMVLSCRPVEKLSATRHPRPYPFWPVDASELAEKLAAISSRAVSYV